MPAHPTTVAEYCDVLTRSKLLPDGEVPTLVKRWAESGGGDADVDGFCKFLVARKRVTEYQAALVARGRADGFRLGGYTILDRLGRGASAGVYKAAHPSGQVVALKVLPASRATDPNVLTRFQREGRMLSQLDHPNVVRAFHVGQTGSVHFIVMEHLDGETLDEVLARRKKLPVPEAARLVAQALRGLQHLHERRTVHRDLKPANLMVTPADGDATFDATVKLLDIGIGRELFADDSPETKDLMLTTEGAIIGTPDYLAPEQARDSRSADVRADVYSLGCVLFHLVTGRPPFTDKNVLALAVKHATEPLPRLADLLPGVPAAFQVVLDRMTAKKPEERYQTPSEAANALRPFVPPDAHTAIASPVVPGYKQWLETESGMELPEAVKKAGTASAPVIAVPPAPPSKPAVPKASTATKPVKPAAPPRPSGAVAPAPPSRPVAAAPVEETIDVELVKLPAGGGDARSVLKWTRRDYMLLTMGAGGMFAAVGVGFTLARLIRGSPKDDAAE